MSDLATLIAQLSGSSPQPASDPALAAVKLARASIDALVLRLGQTIDARVVGQIAAGLTQLAAGNESFVLKLETPLPAGTMVNIKVTPTPQGMPAVTVSVPAPALQAARPPLSLPTPTSPLVEAQVPLPAVATPAPTAPRQLPQAVQLPLPDPVTPPSPMAAGPARPAQAGPATAPSPLPPAAGQPDTEHRPQPATPANAAAAQPATPRQATQAPQLPQPVLPVGPQPQPASSQPAAQVAPPVTTPRAQPAAAQPASASIVPPPSTPAPALLQSATPVAISPTSPQPATVPTPATVAPTPPAQPALILATPLAAQPQQPLPTHPSPYPVHLPHTATPAVAQQLPLSANAAAASRPTAPAFNLADPAQAAARQDSAAPLLARLAAIVTAAAPSLPRPLIDLALKVLATRLDLNRGAPDANTLEAAVLKAGVLLTPLGREPADSKSALLALRSGLRALLGGDTAASTTPAERPAPPIKGDPPRAPTPQAALPDPSADTRDTARALLGHTDAALSRLKLLQSASQPVTDTRTDGPLPRNELRVEIPMLLGAETGILQLLVERDGKHKREPERQRGWRMRFAMNFSATGEVGADIAMLGRSASIAIWAADPDIADALDELLPELAPAIQRHGLELTSLRVRRGAPRHAQAAPGQQLDSAR